MWRPRTKLGIRRKLKGLGRRVVGAVRPDRASSEAPAASAAPVDEAPPMAAEPSAVPEPAPAPKSPEAPPAAEPTQTATATDASEPATPEPQPGQPAQEGSLSVERIEEVLDDMVRPALHADGGDIELVKVDGRDIHVSLVGACSTCPSALVTLRMGVERLLQEEFPEMGELVQVEA